MRDAIFIPPDGSDLVLWKLCNLMSRVPSRDKRGRSFIMNFEYLQTHKLWKLGMELIARSDSNIKSFHLLGGQQDFTLERDKTRSIKFSPDNVQNARQNFVWEPGRSLSWRSFLRDGNCFLEGKIIFIKL
jgi:hypothetical protein